MNDKTKIVATAAVRKSYNAAKMAEAKGYGAFIEAIQSIAPRALEALGQDKLSVAEFAAYVQDDLSVGKDVSDEDKAERNRIRARIRYALNEAGVLAEKARSPQQGKKGKGKKPGKTKGEEAADAASLVKDAANDKERFALICTMLDAMGRDGLQRVAAAVATRLAGASTGEEAPAKPARQRVAKKAA